MKKYLLILNVLATIWSCGEMNDLHQIYLDRGEIIYTGAVDSLEVSGGLNRVKLKWEMNADPRIQDLIIRWNNKSDSVIIDVERSASNTGFYKDSIILDENMAEGNVVLQLYTRDGVGHTSIVREITGTVYGQGFASAAALRLPRKISSVELIDNETVKIKFDVSEDIYMSATNVYYTCYSDSQEGKTMTVTVAKDETEVLLTGVRAGEEISYQSFFYPEINALDSFEGKLQTYKLPGNHLELVWSEEFEENGLLNEKFWTYDEGYERNNELQDYKKADSKYARVEDGKLILEAHKDPHEGINKWTGEPYHFEYSSAEVRTLNENGFLYGRLDVSAKIPTGRGVWPAIWLMPTDGRYGGWPDCGEIDVMEYVWGDDEGHNRFWCTLHTKDSDTNGNRINGGSIISETLNTEFHLYSLVWDEDKIEILFDDQSLFTYERKPDANFETWPFDRPFYLIMNIAVGGAWGGSWGIDESIFPARMEIDYVRYYQYR